MKINYLIFTALTLLSFSCTNDKVDLLSNFDNCELGIDSFSIISINNDTMWNFLTCNYNEEYFGNDKNINNVVPSPLDSNSISYLKFTYGPSNCFLKVFDLCTGEIFETDGVECTELDWSINDWILFRKNNSLFKMKPNGDSLIELSQIPNNSQFFKWSADGSKITYHKSAGINSKFVIANENLEEISDIEELKYIGIYEWTSNNNIYVVSGTDSMTYGIYKYDLQSEEFTPIHIVNFEHLIHDISINETSQIIYYSSTSGVYQYDLDLNQSIQLLNQTSNRTYEGAINIIEDDKLLTIRQNKTLVTPCYVEVIEKINFYNPINNIEKELTIE